MTLPFKTLPSVSESKERLKDRLRTTIAIYVPLTAMISTTICLVLSGHLLPAVNPRLGNPAEVMELSSDGKPGDIFLSISADGGQLVAFDSNRRTARWPIGSRTLADVQSFSELLQRNVRDGLLTSSLSNRSVASQTRVILSVDQHLRYFHIKPILYALAEARICSYTFEVKHPEKDHIATIFPKILREEDATLQ